MGWKDAPLVSTQTDTGDQPKWKSAPLANDSKSQSSGFLDRVKGDVQSRFEKMGEEKARTDMGQQTGIEENVQGIGQLAGTVNDVGGEALVSAGKGIASVTPDSIKQKVTESLQKLGNTPIIKAGVKALGSGVDAWNNFQKENPRVADDISGVFNIALSGIPVGKTAEAAVEVAPKIGKGIESASKSIGEGVGLLRAGADARTPEELHDVVASMKESSGNLYKQSRELGATFTPSANQNLISSLDKTLSSTGQLHPRLHGDTMAFIDDLKKDIQTNGMDLERLDQHRQWLREVEMRNLDNFGRPNSDAHKAGLAIKAIDDSVEKLTPADIAKGDPKAVNSLLQARSQWKSAKKFESVTDAISKADGDVAKAKSNIKKLINSKRGAGFTAEEKAVLKKASDSGTFETMAKMIGKVGIDEKHTTIPIALGLGGAAIHNPAALPAIAAGTGAKSIEKLIGRGKIEDALKYMESQSPQAAQTMESLE